MFYPFLNQPLAYNQFPSVTNRQKVIKDRLMLIFCVHRHRSIKRQQHNIYYAALFTFITPHSHSFDVIGDVTLNAPLREALLVKCSACLLIEQQWDSDVVRLQPITALDKLQSRSRCRRSVQVR